MKKGKKAQYMRLSLKDGRLMMNSSGFKSNFEQVGFLEVFQTILLKGGFK